MERERDYAPAIEGWGGLTVDDWGVIDGGTVLIEGYRD